MVSKVWKRDGLGPRAVAQLQIILKLGFPNCIENFSSFLPGFTLLIVMGQLGPDEIAGAGMGFMFGNGLQFFSKMYFDFDLIFCFCCWYFQ